MTPQQRKYDQDLASSMRLLATSIAKRSQKIALTLRMGADRLEALSTALPLTGPDPTATTPFAQPASTPALQPVRD